MIAAEGVRIAVEGRVLFDRLDFALPKGEFVAMLGANGAGKTTLLRTLGGLRAPGAGAIAFGERAVNTLAPAERARAIAYLATDDLFEDRLTVRDVVAVGRYAHHAWWQWSQDAEDVRAIEFALREVGMDAFADRIFATLSTGERQRVWIALALAQEAPVLLLDEPTSHLDVRVAQEILAVLRAQLARGKTILSVLHDPNEAAAYADRVLLLGEGRVLAYDSPAVALEPALLERAYGTAMEQVRTASGAVRVFPVARPGL